ncbi:hypothetical protein BDN72DRAFT_832163 [Pluteus cervinus]|uniref:Uncharacterized protein n=1 Tax=Pluteus cervinus TaxID=181527 RepID=A0ACD3BCB5_9AGAR|nr:hypothetical protein BDN72DRAFT_832163 [Pluteus cervinus]
MAGSLLDHLISSLWYANATRYLNAAGLTALLYDHALTFPSEVSLIWCGPRSLQKYIFLLNRYMVPSILLVVAIEMTGFGTRALSNQSCQYIITTAALGSTISLATANLLVLLRVASLWEKDPVATKLLGVGFVLSTLSTFSSMVVALSRVYTSIQYFSVASMCVLIQTTDVLIVAWSCPLVFEVVVLLSTFWNAVSKPRDAQLPLARALHRDGMLVFLSLATLRVVNLALAATRRIDLVLLLVFFVWSMITLILNRSLLRMRKAEIMDALPETKSEQPPIESKSAKRLRRTLQSGHVG